MLGPLIDDDHYEDDIDIILDDEHDDEPLTDEDFELLYELEQQGAFI